MWRKWYYFETKGKNCKGNSTALTVERRYLWGNSCTLIEMNTSVRTNTYTLIEGGCEGNDIALVKGKWIQL